MKTLILFIFLLLAFAHSQSFQVVSVKGEDVTAYCSGAVVEGRGISAGHCFKDNEIGDTVYLRDENLNLYRATLEESCLEWPRCDYAVLSGAFTYLLPSLEIAKEIVIDEKVSYTGSPVRLGLFHFSGRYLGLVWGDKVNKQVGTMMLFDITAWKGASGSIFVNEKGEAVAILVGVYGDGQLNIAIGVRLPV
jgi:hypothetical protein